MLWDIVSNCITKLEFEDCVIYLLDEKRNVLVQKAAYGDKSLDGEADQGSRSRFPWATALSAAWRKPGRPELIRDTHARTPVTSSTTGNDGRNWRCRFSRKAVSSGVIDSEHSRCENFYDDFHLETLQDLAAISGTKIAKTLHQQEREDIALFRPGEPQPGFPGVLGFRYFPEPIHACAGDP